MTRREGFGVEIAEKAVAIGDFDGFKLTRTSNGVSTEVYRMEKGNDIFYLRVAGKGKKFWPETEAHRKCLEKGVLVPEVVFYEENNQTLGRSVMITTTIEGENLKEETNNLTEVLVEAGRNLALINSIPTDGIGWISDRSRSHELRGEGVDYNGFILDDVDEKVRKLVDFGLFDTALADKVTKYIRDNTGELLEYRQGHLAHGDFDRSHIFSQNGKFTGIIDFGDIRSASPYHDLAHFYTYARRHFPDLIMGYKEITQLSGNFEERIRIEAVVMAIGKLSWVGEKRINKLTTERVDYQLVREMVGTGV